MNPAIVRRPVVTVKGGRRQSRTDTLAVEEPLEIRVHDQSIAVTMRTPGHDFELAAGFLLSEGAIHARADIRQIRYCAKPQNYNIVTVHLRPGFEFDAKRFSRHVFTSSSCGVCGKASLEQIRAVRPQPLLPAKPISAEIMLSLPDKLREAQAVFARTGGLHAAALFDADGRLLSLHEDVGRHNAMDKLVGARLLKDKLPARDTIVLVSGRASFELIQKALMAGIPTLAAVGAPSSLAVDLAREFGMTLVGFLRDDRYNIYT